MFSDNALPVNLSKREILQIGGAKLMAWKQSFLMKPTENKVQQDDNGTHLQRDARWLFGKLENIFFLFFFLSDMHHYQNYTKTVQKKSHSLCWQFDAGTGRVGSFTQQNLKIFIKKGEKEEKIFMHPSNCPTQVWKGEY